MTQIKKFEIGKRYGMNSICDSDCWWYYTVIARTECTVTLQDENGKIIKCRMNSKRNQIWGCEAVRPLGSYSMCPTLTADRECPEEPQMKLHDEVRANGVTTDGRSIKVVERYDEIAVNRGCFVILDGEEIEYGSLSGALLFFKDLTQPQKSEPKAVIIPLSAHGTLVIAGLKR